MVDLCSRLILRFRREIVEKCESVSSQNATKFHSFVRCVLSYVVSYFNKRRDVEFLLYQRHYTGNLLKLGRGLFHEVNVTIGAGIFWESECMSCLNKQE